MASPERDNLEADLSAYLDGELDEPRAREIERHLSQSPEARRVLASLRRMRQRLASLPRMHAPPALAAEILRQAEHAAVASSRSTRRVRVIRLFASVAASAAVLVVCVLVGYRELHRPAVTGVAVAEKTPPLRKGAPEARETTMGVSRAKPLGKAAGEAPAAEPAVAMANKTRPEVDDATRRRLASLGYLAEGDRAAPPAPERGLGATLAGERFAALADTGGPVVSVWVTPRNEAEYIAAASVLDEWSTARPSYTADRVADRKLDHDKDSRSLGFVNRDASDTAATPKLKTQTQPLERVYQFQVPDLNRRIDELASQVATPSQVHVQMNFTAAAGRPSAGAIRAVDVVGPPGPAPPSAAEAGRTPEAGLAEGKRVEAETSGGGAAVAKPSARGAAPTSPAPEEAAGGTAVAAGAKMGAAAERAKKEEPKRAEKRESARARHDEQHRAAASQALPQTVVASRVPVSQPTTDAALAQSQPLVETKDVPEPALSADLIGRLLDLLLIGMRSEEATVSRNGDGYADTQPAGDFVTFRVMLLPPSPPASAPTPQP